jgi:leader peptidase (prepilin peptidase)/N-methyltransferase
MWKSLLENIQGIVLMVGLGFLALEDIKTHKIRSMSIIVFALVGAILSFLNGNWFDWRLILGFIPGIIVLFLGLLTKETIGYGDGLVVLALGCYLNIFEIIGLSMLALSIFDRRIS